MTIPIPAPMLASPGGRPFTDLAWLCEIKFDGYRTLARFGDGKVELRSKSGADCTGWYPEVVGSLALISGGPFIIDGEACVLDELGRSDFNRLQDRARRRRWYAGCDQVTYCVFDLLVDGGRNIMALPLVERKARLAKVLAPLPKAAVLVVGDLPADASLFDQAVLPLQLEGFLAKRKGSAYQPGVRSPDWVKVKRKGAVPPARFKR